MKGWICSQIGAREHFAIPRALLSRGCLERVFTDLRRSGLEQIDRNFVTTFPIGGLKWWWKLRRSQNSYGDFIENGRWFSEAVRDSLKSQDVEGKVFFGYDTGFLEAAKALKNRGARCVLGQMDPGQVEFEAIREERKRWPKWEPDAVEIPGAYHERRRAEWEIADRVVVNSEWSRKALLAQGIPAERMSVVPLCYEPTVAPPNQLEPSDELRVLWLGQVNLRKGIPYLLKAAEKLKRSNVKFTIVGPIQIDPARVAACPSNVEFTGAVKRSEVGRYYEEADVFVLPTISDGFALTQLEAMAHGLPVITTPNCGDVVTDGKDGFIIPARSSGTLVARLLELGADRERRLTMREEALRTAKRFTLNQLASDLLSIEM